jgi:hypothetical protein
MQRITQTGSTTKLAVRTPYIYEAGRRGDTAASYQLTQIINLIPTKMKALSVKHLAVQKLIKDVAAERGIYNLTNEQIIKAYKCCNTSRISADFYYNLKEYFNN